MSFGTVLITVDLELMRYEFSFSVCSKRFDLAFCFLFGKYLESLKIFKPLTVFFQQHCPHISCMIIYEDKHIPLLSRRWWWDLTTKISVNQLKWFRSTKRCFVACGKGFLVCLPSKQETQVSFVIVTLGMPITRSLFTIIFSVLVFMWPRRTCHIDDSVDDAICRHCTWSACKVTIEPFRTISPPYLSNSISVSSLYEPRILLQWLVPS